MTGRPTRNVDVSVIIPTYNRKGSLLRTLESLAHQTYLPERFEAIVVDDGSADGTADVVQDVYPYNLVYVRQQNAGATIARNHGVAFSRAAVLVFLDDDIALQPPALAGIVGCLDQSAKTIVIGCLEVPKPIAQASPFAGMQALEAKKVTATHDVHCTECQTGLLGVMREDFLSLGMFQDPTGGWPNWDDVDFGYRAHQQGYRVVRCAQAVAEHWDYALADLQTACRRWQRASKSATRLPGRHPGLLALLPMFVDKGPIEWRHDSPRMVTRKLARQMASSRLTMLLMEGIVPVLEARAPTSQALRLLYRWIASGYIYRGYREGLRTVASEDYHA